MRKRSLRIHPLAWTAVIAALVCLFDAAAQAQQPICSAWLIESSRFMNVPFGSFMPDRAFVPGSTKPESNIPTVDLPKFNWRLRVASGLVSFVFGVVLIYGIGFAEGGLFTDAPTWEPR